MNQAECGCVAIVDDDPAVLHSMVFLLKVEGFPVKAYGSAAAYLADTQDDRRCLILDYEMPEMTGLELALALRQAGRSIPILLVTGAPSAELRDGAARAGIEGMVVKPPRDDELVNFVSRYVPFPRPEITI
jgi:FixJ family two-component response regulator